uniref:Eukaryotic peptide chain release factor GTP-binding subunit ERF3A-like n=2 Tax=Nicotiana TaxID=4085 RepID=A0A1S4DCH6_TOBAC
MVKVISALLDEFEAGYRQTREHFILAKALGVSRFVVLINKMDALGWPEERYAEIKLQMSSFLVSTLHKLAMEGDKASLVGLYVVFLPISGRLALNLETPVAKACPWWDGPCLLDVLDTVKVPPRDPRGPLRISIIDVYTPDGTPEGTPFVEVTGKVLSGTIREGDELVVLPNQVDVRVEYIIFFGDEPNTRCAGPGATIHVGLRGVVEAQISPGFVLSDIASPVHAATEFNVELEFLEGRPHIVRMQDYFSGVLYIHAIEVECHVWLSYQLDHPLQYSPVGHMCSTDRLHDWDLEEYNISYCCRPFLQRQREDGVKFLGHIEVDNAICIDLKQGPAGFVLIRN